MRFSLRLLSGLFLSLALCCACGADHNEPTPPPTPDPDPHPAAMGHRTVLVYFVADNNLESFAMDDIQEILDGAKSATIDLDKDQMIVYVDGKDLPILYRVGRDKDKNPVLETVVKYEEELTSTSTEVISGVIKTVVDKFPAQHYGMVYWSHGDGWKPASLKYAQHALNPLSHVGSDENNSTEYSRKRTDIPDLSKCLENFPKKLDFLFFDACFMLSIETAWDLRNQTDCVIGCPTETPGPGAPFDLVSVAMLSSSDFSAETFSQIYFNYYNALYNGGSGGSDSHWTSGVSIGVIRTDALAPLAEFCALLAKEGRLKDTGISGVLDYDKRSQGSKVGYFDMVGLYESMIQSAEDYTSWLTLYNKAVPFFKTTPKNYSSTVHMFDMYGAHGASHYYPLDSYYVEKLNEAYRKTSWYEAAGLSYLGW